MTMKAVPLFALVLFINCVSCDSHQQESQKASMLPEVNAISKQQDFKIYNDPSSDQVIIVFRSGRAGKASLSVFTINGRLLDRREFPLNKGLNTWYYGFVFKSTGTYLMRLVADGKERSARFFKSVS